jgi:hypothetical protein
MYEISRWWWPARGGGGVRIGGVGADMMCRQALKDVSRLWKELCVTGNGRWCYPCYLRFCQLGKPVMLHCRHSPADWLACGSADTSSVRL